MWLHYWPLWCFQCFLLWMEPQLIAFFIFAFIAAHGIGQGTVIWVFISEIFPNRIRASGQSFGSGIHWVFAALITLLGPSVIEFLLRILGQFLLFLLS